METKLSKLVLAAKAGDWQTALRIAARFQDLGTQRDAIKRAHEAHSNPGFYSQLGRDPAALIAAGIEALKTRYPTQLGETKMTNLANTAIAQLTAAITGGGFKRANSKEAAIKRFLSAAAEKGISADDANAILLAEDAAAALNAVLNPAAAVAEKPAKAKAKAAPKAKAPVEAKAKPMGKRAEIEAAAANGVIPTAPDFSAETHKAWRKRLAEVVAMVEAGDIKGLKANTIEPKSSSRKAICTFRDLAIVALEARAATTVAA